MEKRVTNPDLLGGIPAIISGNDPNGHRMKGIEALDYTL